MKKMQTWTAIFAALALGALVFAGCSNPVSNGPPQTGKDTPDIPAGFGTVRVSLSQGAARTVMPEPVLSDLYLQYWFTKDSGEPEEQSPEGGVFTLKPGTYTLWVEVFVDPAKTELAADGSSASFMVTAGAETATVNVTLRPIASEGTGSLAFSLTYPAGGAVEYLTLTRIAGAETIDLTAGVTPSGGDPDVFSGEKTGIASGYYRLDVRIRDGAGAYAGKSETAHIYQNLSTQAVYVFTAEDFSLHTVTYSAGAGGGTAPASVGVNGGSSITLPGSGDMIAPADKFFIGWSDGAALYWAEDSYTVNDNVTLTAQWELTTIGEVEAYLDHTAGGGAADPVPLPVNLALGDGGWDALLTALNTAGKYAALNLTDSAITGMSSTAGEFDPGEANTGEQYIVSLVLPDTATGIKAGNYWVSGAFKNFTALTNVSGIGVMAVGDCAFGECTSLAEVSLPAATYIGSDAFERTSLAEVSLPAAAFIGDAAFANCTSLAEVSLPVATSIGNSAFFSCTSLAEVNLPAAESIGSDAFLGCKSLVELSLPVATSIGVEAFFECTSLTEVSLPAATSIGTGTFLGCTSLVELSLPATLTTIGANPFAGCVNLTNIIVDLDNTAFKTQGGMLLNKAGTTLIAYPSATGRVTLDSVTAIGAEAFRGCMSLAEVSLPAATAIGKLAFAYCMSLAEVSLPAAIAIGDYAFFSCTSLAEVSLPAATAIGDYAFGYTSLAELSLPAATSIGDGTFRDCTSLTELSLPAAPPTVGSDMFFNINTAKTVTIKILAGSASAYNTTWQTAFKGVGGSASALNTGDAAGTENANITLILQAQYGDVSANVILWANEDGNILGSPTDMRISKTASGYPDSFTVTVADAYTLVQWQVNGVPLGFPGNPLTIAAADYAVGKTYILGVQVTKDGVPYSTDIRFMVEA
jgi:hypothetical protein